MNSKHFGLVVFVFVLHAVAAPAALADDLGWLQSGVRVWYAGGTGGDPTNALTYSNAQEADLIDVVAGQVHVIQQAAVANWTSPMAGADLICLTPADEGPFWIHPDRLRAVQPGIGTGLINWLGTDRLVFARTSYTYDTLPFLKLLPAKALFELRATREFVVLQNASSSSTTGEYYFDIETGLLFCKTEELVDYGRTSLTLAEINYDFATQHALTEDSGPHTGYSGVFRASSYGFLSNSSFQMTSQVLSRYGNLILADLQSNYGNVATGQYATVNNYLYYDGPAQTASIRSETVEDWAVNGDHLFWWIPPADLARSQITVSNLELPRQTPTAASTTFGTGVQPADAALTSLTFDSGGFLTDLTVNIPSMQININSALDPGKDIRVNGRSYYAASMKPAVPSGVSLVGGGDGTGEGTGAAGTQNTEAAGTSQGGAACGAGAGLPILACGLLFATGRFSRRRRP